jgi:hypothetical protein
LHTNIGQVDTSRIATATVDIKGCTHEEHGEPTNGVESLERRDTSADIVDERYTLGHTLQKYLMKSCELNWLRLRPQ